MTGCLGDSDTYTLYGTMIGLPAVQAGAAAYLQYRCDLSVEEREDQLFYYPPNVFAVVPPSVRGASRWIRMLSSEELAPIATSVWYAMSISPTVNGISAMTYPLVWAVTDNRTDLLENMVVNGANAAVHEIYLNRLPRGMGGLNTTQRTADASTYHTQVEAFVNAYLWGQGWKAYAYGSAAAVLGLVGMASVAVGCRKCLGYDPSDWPKTVAMSMKSGPQLDRAQGNGVPDLDGGRYFLALRNGSHGEYFVIERDYR